MAEYATKNEVQKIVDKAVADLSEVITNFAQQVDDRFNENEIKIDKIEYRLDTIETRLDAIDAKYNHLVNTLDTFISRIDRYESEQLARDNQFNRLLEWAPKVSEKTGIPLENL